MTAVLHFLVRDSRSRFPDFVLLFRLASDYFCLRSAGAGQVAGRQCEGHLRHHRLRHGRGQAGRQVSTALWTAGTG